MPPAKQVKLVERFKNRQSAAVAQRSSSRFTDHQSSNARRREEEQMRTVTAFGSTSRQFSGGSLTTTDAGNPLELTFQSRRPAPVTEEKQAFLSSAECRQRQQRMQDFSRPGGRPSSFERQAKPWGHSSPVPRAAVSSGAVSGTRARARERFSLRDNEAPLHGAENGRGEFTLLGKRTHDGPASLGTGTTIGGAGLLGHYAPRPSATTGYASSAAHPGPNVQGENDDEGVEPEAKKSRLERFQEIVSNSKSRRAELQQQRLERERATNTLDAEFKEIFHLLPRRDRIREDREAFEATGTPEMRAYLAAFKKGHAARILRVKSNGEATVALLAGGPEKTVTLEGKSRPQRAATHNGGATAVSSHGLDEQDKALLRRIYSGEGKEDAVGEASDSAVVASPSGVTVPAPIPGRRGAGGSARSAFEAVGGGDEDDEFDQLMNVIRLETRKAHAVERTATEEEEAARAAQDAMLEADRGAVPRLGLEEEEQVQRTRGEWLQQGGDRVFRMGDEDEAAEEDNVVLPEFTESDESDAGEAAGSGADDDAETDGRAERAPLNKLDAALEQLEQLARGRVEATPHVGGGRAQVERCEAFQAILVTLHSYGKRHAVHLAQTFRLILVEAEREFLKSRRAPSKLMLTYLYTMTKLFPMSDFRHEVSTPLVIFLCSCLMQMRLLTRRDVHVYVMLTGMLSEALLPSGPKFAAEIIVAIMNVLCLQLPECVLEPLKYHGLTVSFPVVERVTEALLGDSFIGASVGGPAVCSPAAKTPQGFLQASRAVWAPLSLTGDAATVDARGDSARLLLSVYRILDAVATSWRRMAGFTYAVAAPFEEVDGLLRGSLDHAWLQEHAADFAFFTTSPHGTPAARSSAPPAAQGTWRPHPDVLRAHLLMMERIRQYEGGVIAKRTPLAMRTTRVRPLRLFDPMLEEAFDTDKAEERMLKKTLREDKKRAVRHVQSDAMVDRRLREKEESQTRDLRLQKYNELLGELQRQQHVMKTVDMLKTKARSKKHKSISGAPSAGDAGVGEDGPSSHGGE